MEKARKELGFDVRVHDLKYTFVSRLRSGGVSDIDRKELLGHKSRDTLEYYCSGDIRRLIEAANKVLKVSRNPLILTVVKAINW